VSAACETSHLRLLPGPDLRVAAEDLAGNTRTLRMPGRDVARKLARVDLADIDAAIWRHVSPREQARPDSADGAIGAGGRFNPPGSFSAIYGALSRAEAGTEFRRMASRHPIGIDNLLPRHLYRFRITSSSVLDLRDPMVRSILELPEKEMAAIHRAHTQLIGEMARALGIEIIIDSGIVAIFPDLAAISPWQFDHIAIWQTKADVPELVGTAPNPSGMTQRTAKEAYLSMGGNYQ
jgi:RES domain-containing protein